MTAADAALDVASLRSYLAAEAGLEVTGAEVVHDDVNLLVVLSTGGEAPSHVLRRPNAPRDAATFNGLVHEYRLLERLRPTVVPAPEPVVLCEDASVIGEPFLLMTYVPGQTVGVGEDLPPDFRNRAGRRAAGRRLVEALALVKDLAVEPFAPLCERRPPPAQVSWVTDRIDAATRTTGHDPPGLRETLDWLAAEAPTGGPVALVHGDYRPANVRFGGVEAIEVAGVIDWETAFLGDPRYDLGYFLTTWRDPDDRPPGPADLQTPPADDAQRRAIQGMADHGHGLCCTGPGSPTRSQLVAVYEARTGLAVERPRFFQALGAAAIATVWSEFHARVLAAGDESRWAPLVEWMALTAADHADSRY